MKPKYKIGEVFYCWGSIIVITEVIIFNYKQHKYLYKFNHLRSGSLSDVWPFFINCYESELDNFEKIEL